VIFPAVSLKLDSELSLFLNGKLRAHVADVQRAQPLRRSLSTMELRLNLVEAPSAADLAHADLDRVVTLEADETGKPRADEHRRLRGRQFDLTWQIDYTVDDPTGAYPNPTLGASGVTVYSTTNGSSTPTYATFSTPVAAIRLTMNALSSAGGKVTATILQAGIG
jgi:hypothetical protein